MNSALLTAVALGLYLAAAVCFGAVLFLDSTGAPAPGGKSKPSSRPSRYAGMFALSGAAALFLSIGVNCSVTHHSPFASQYGTLVVSAWITSVIYLWLDRRSRMPAVGAVITFAVCVVLGFAYSRSSGPIAADPLLGRLIVTIHVITIIAAYGLVLVASGCAGLYLIQDRLLKKHSRSHFSGRLPALTMLDSVGFTSVAYALPLVTISLGVGLAMVFGGAAGPMHAPWFTDPRFVSTAVLWALFAGYLSARLAAGWRGVRLQYILFIGVMCAVCAYALPTASAHHFH